MFTENDNYFVTEHENSGQALDDSNGQSYFGKYQDSNQFQMAENSSQFSQDKQPECIRKWLIEFDQRIQASDARESEHLEQMEEEGSKELHNWANQYRKTLASGIKQSRAHDKELRVEQEAAASISSSLSNTDASQSVLWERICHLCNFVPLPSATSDDGVVAGKKPKKEPKDLSRMRTLLVQLKQHPPSSIRRMG